MRIVEMHDAINKVLITIMYLILILLFQGCNGTPDKTISDSPPKPTTQLSESKGIEVEFDTTNYNALKKNNPYFNDFLYKQRLIVLKKNKPGFEMIFRKKTKEYVFKQRVTYLGNITTSNGVVLKFVSSVNYTYYSDNIRCFSQLRIYNSNNYEIGAYFFFCYEAISSYIEKSNVVLTNPTPNCNVKSRIDFYNGIPSMISVHCAEINNELDGEGFPFSYSTNYYQ